MPKQIKPPVKTKPVVEKPARTSNKATHLTVAIGDVRPNTWNQNRMSSFMLEKLKAGIEAMLPAFVDPVTVRSGDEKGKFKDGKKEIIDGEHRWRVAQELGLAEIPVVDLGLVATPVAKTLTITLNETKGKPDVDQLAVLVAELSKDENLAAILPYDQPEIDAYVTANAANLEALEKAAAENAARLVEQAADDDGEESEDSPVNVIDVLRLEEIEADEDERLVARLTAISERIEHKKASSLLWSLIKASEKSLGIKP